MDAALEVVSPGLMTTIQDVLGRRGFERYGVPVGGAADPFNAMQANALVGNADNAPLIECTLLGPTLRFAAPIPTVFALTGANMGASLDGRPVAVGWSWVAPPGALLELGEAKAGARTYLGIAGGLRVPLVLGSAATDVRGAFGGFQGRPLRAGDRISYSPDRRSYTRSGCASAIPAEEVEAPVRVLPGPHAHQLDAAALGRLCCEDWTVDVNFDRMAVRLQGPRLTQADGAEVTSLGLPLGAIQVPGDGQPIVLLADHQPTGGFAVIACVIRADIGSVAQCRPGSLVRFALTTPDEARQALRARVAAAHGFVADGAWRQAGLAG